MNVKLSGPNSELESAAKKKLITEKELKQVLLDANRTDLLRAKTRLQELLAFYDRIIASINTSINSINKKQQLTHTQKKDLYIDTHERDLSQSKREKSKFRRYLLQINELIDNK